MRGGGGDFPLLFLKKKPRPSGASHRQTLFAKLFSRTPLPLLQALDPPLHGTVEVGAWFAGSPLIIKPKLRNAWPRRRDTLIAKDPGIANDILQPDNSKMMEKNPNIANPVITDALSKSVGTSLYWVFAVKCISSWQKKKERR